MIGSTSRMSARRFLTSPPNRRPGEKAIMGAWWARDTRRSVWMAGFMISPETLPSRRRLLSDLRIRGRNHFLPGRRRLHRRRRTAFHVLKIRGHIIWKSSRRKSSPHDNGCRPLWHMPIGWTTKVFHRQPRLCMILLCKWQWKGFHLALGMSWMWKREWFTTAQTKYLRIYYLRLRQLAGVKHKQIIFPPPYRYFFPSFAPDDGFLLIPRYNREKKVLQCRPASVRQSDPTSPHRPTLLSPQTGMNLNSEPQPQSARKQVSWFLSGRFSSLPRFLRPPKQSPRIPNHHLHPPTFPELLHPSSPFSLLPLPPPLPNQAPSQTLKNQVCAGRVTPLTLLKKRSSPHSILTKKRGTNAPNVLTREWTTGPRWSDASSKKRMLHVWTWRGRSSSSNFSSSRAANPKTGQAKARAGIGSGKEREASVELESIHLDLNPKLAMDSELDPDLHLCLDLYLDLNL